MPERDRETKSTEARGKPGMQERTRAEWVTLAISVAIVLALAGLLTFNYISRGTEPPALVAEPKLEEVRQAEAGYYLPIDITNNGDLLAQNVQVALTFTPEEGEPEEVQFEVQFLNGRETASRTVVLRADPSGTELSSNFSFDTP